MSSERNCNGSNLLQDICAQELSRRTESVVPFLLTVCETVRILITDELNWSIAACLGIKQTDERYKL